MPRGGGGHQGKIYGGSRRSPPKWKMWKILFVCENDMLQSWKWGFLTWHIYPICLYIEVPPPPWKLRPFLLVIWGSHLLDSEDLLGFIWAGKILAVVTKFTSLLTIVAFKVYLYTPPPQKKKIIDMWKGQSRSPLHQHSVKEIHFKVKDLRGDYPNNYQNVVPVIFRVAGRRALAWWQDPRVHIPCRRALA